MEIITDLHIHSKYSRGCSKDLDLVNLEKWAKIKGIGLLGTGDFTHPKWIIELKENLTEDGSGVLKTKTGFPFVLQTEVSIVYTQNDKGRRMHVIILAPNFEIVDKITEYFLSNGRIDYDGRPIFKISANKLVKDLIEISNKIEVIPAHIWTPWFSLFGSKSGFDTVEEAFGDQSKHIHALETGLSSDPKMNRRLPNLDNYQLVSFSDCHSFWPWRLGREATIMDIDLTYDSLLSALRTGKGIKETIEVDPNYGKYHYDGHRNCGVSFSPRETLKTKGICPVCRKKLTVGVLNRVNELAKLGEKSLSNSEKYYTLVPLHDLIALYFNCGVNTKKTWEIYDILIAKFNNEFNILLNVNLSELKKVVVSEIAELIIKNRKGNIEVIPGFDGEYGIPIISEDKRPKKLVPKFHPQKGLENFA